MLQGKRKAKKKVKREQNKIDKGVTSADRHRSRGGHR